MCIFCKIVAGEIPSYTLYEDNICKVIYDINPINKGHVLVVSKDHYSDMYSTPDDVLCHLIKIVKEIHMCVNDLYNADGISILENYGIVQEIKHIHFHIIPVFEDSKAITFNRNCTIESSLEKFEELKDKIKLSISN